MADVFEKRLRRAEFLAKEWPFAAELLRLFIGLTEVQQEMFDRGEHPDAHRSDDPFAAYSRLLEVVRTRAPAPLAERAREMDPGYLADLVQRMSSGDHRGDPVELFFVRVLEFPELHSSEGRRLFGEYLKDHASSGTCPMCDLPPLLSVLREDKQAETVRRTLLCPRCSNEWDFARVVCPSCNEEKPEKLPRYTAQEIPWMRVEACDTCRKFLKSVDLALNWDADPVVDELASTPLDVIAAEHGYVKIAPNLAGI